MAVPVPPVGLLSGVSTRRSATSGSSKLSPDVSGDEGAGSANCCMSGVISGNSVGECMSDGAFGSSVSLESACFVSVATAGVNASIVGVTEAAGVAGALSNSG